MDYPWVARAIRGWPGSATGPEHIGLLDLIAKDVLLPRAPTGAGNTGRSGTSSLDGVFFGGLPLGRPLPSSGAHMAVDPLSDVSELGLRGGSCYVR